MESMTGFAQGGVQSDRFLFSIQMKSVNGRFLDTKFNSSFELMYLEPKFRELIKARFQRGSFDIYLSFKEFTLSDLSEVDGVKSWISSYKENAKALNVTDDLTFGTVVKWGGTAFKRKELPHDVEKSLLLEFNETLERIKVSRNLEGEGLKQELSRELENLGAELSKLHPLIKEYSKTLEIQWRSRIEKIPIEFDPERLEQEIAILLEKSDITEEVARLSLHVERFQELLDSQDPSVGKKLDFYCQELAREANTIASKAKLETLTRLSVNMKSSIEKLRQQVQNIQ